MYTQQRFIAASTKISPYEGIPFRSALRPNLAIPYSLTANDVIRKPLRFPDFPYNVDITL